MTTIAITGASGMVGTALTNAFRARGEVVVPISRKAVPGGVQWNPARGTMDATALNGVDAIINLAGENLAHGRWTPHRKRALWSSRIDATGLIARTAAAMDPRPRVLISASAMGYYGSNGDKVLDESAPRGQDFLAALCVAWEAAAQPARAAGVRVVHPRFGIILSPHDGALAPMLRQFRLGAGGRMGDGKQWMSWIAIDDVVHAIDFAMRTGALDGPVNVASPNPVTNAEFARVLAKVLHRPALFAIPAGVLQVLLGEMADAALLSSARLAPRRLAEAGFTFELPELEGALRAVLRSPADTPRRAP